jgi:hypothetical protein
MGRGENFIKGLLLLVLLAFISINVFAGKLYIKPDLERKRVARLLSEADSDFRNAKIHIGLSPELALPEFESSKEKYKQAIEIIDKYGEGYYTPGDLDDFSNRVKECDTWISKSQEALSAAKSSKATTTAP